MRYAIILLSMLLQIGARSIEPGFYSIVDDRAKADEVFQVSAKADRELTFGSDLRCDLGLGTVREGVRTPIFLSRDEVESFLRGEKHKEILVVWCDKTIMWSDKKETLIAEVRKFVTRLGYQRILLLGAHASGVHVIADISKAKGEPESATNRPPTATPDVSGERH